MHARQDVGLRPGERLGVRRLRRRVPGRSPPCLRTVQATPAPNGDGASDPLIETWGEFNPGTGFLVGRSSLGELAISGYGLVRYINQTPAEQEFTDHLGNTRPVDGRNDIYPHRVMVFFKGWLGTRKLIYSMTFWTVLDTSQNAIFTNVGYQFHRKFSIYAGLNGNPGTRSLQGNHPLWLGNDRVMADEFFRPFFGSGVWAQGEVVPGLWYNAMLSNNNSILDVKSSQLDRKWTTGASTWWMPTTEGVRSQGRLRRLGMPRGRGDPLRRLLDEEPRAAVHRRPHRWSGQHHAQAGRQRERVRDRRAGRRRHRGHRGLRDPGVRCRHEIQGHLPADRDLQPLARQLHGRRPAAGRQHPRHRLLRPGGVLPREEEARGLRRDLADLRRQGRRLRRQLRVPDRDELSTRSTRATSGSTCS